MPNYETDKELDAAFLKNKPASANDCTGLIHDTPSDDDDMESYAEMYDIPEQGSLHSGEQPSDLK